MKRLDAINQIHRLHSVNAAPHFLTFLPGFALAGAHRPEHGSGKCGMFLCESSEGALCQRIRMAVVDCDNCEAMPIDRIIQHAAYTGNKTDVIVVVSNVDKVICVRNQRAGL